MLAAAYQCQVVRPVKHGDITDPASGGVGLDLAPSQRRRLGRHPIEVSLHSGINGIRIVDVEAILVANGKASLVLVELDIQKLGFL